MSGQVTRLVRENTDVQFRQSIRRLDSRGLRRLPGPSYFRVVCGRSRCARQRSSPETVLETAAGSGVVPRALAPLLDAEARYVVTDLNQPMLDRAIARQAADTRIVWQQADALKLPFEDESFDAVCCQFGVMFFPDRVAGYQEALRVLRPGGRFFFNVWDSIQQNDFARVVTEAAGKLFPERPAPLSGPNATRIS